MYRPLIVIYAICVLGQLAIAFHRGWEDSLVSDAIMGGLGLAVLLQIDRWMKKGAAAALQDGGAGQMEGGDSPSPHISRRHAVWLLSLAVPFMIAGGALVVLASLLYCGLVGGPAYGKSGDPHFVFTILLFLVGTVFFSFGSWRVWRASRAR